MSGTSAGEVGKLQGIEMDMLRAENIRAYGMLQKYRE